MFLIAAIGKMRAGPEQDLVTRYQTRIHPKLHITELAEARGSVSEIRRREGVALLQATRDFQCRIALDEGGDLLSSVELASRMDQAIENGHAIAFIIGGAEGLDRDVLDSCQSHLSFGRMTWPHMMVRAMLSEQIYRARSISAGHPYHRSTRP